MWKLWLAALLGSSYCLVTYGPKTVASTIWELGAAGYRFVVPLPPFPDPIDVRPGSNPILQVVISIDDAMLSSLGFYEVLLKNRLRCTLFVIPLRVGKFGFMSWEQIEEARKGGCTIESHTSTHPVLPTLTPAKAMEEIAGSRLLLKEQGYDVTVIASPEGEAGERERRMMREAGYVAHVEGYGGERRKKLNDASSGWSGLDPYRLARHDVKNYDGADDICEAIDKAKGKPEILIFVYHYVTERPKPSAKKANTKTKKDEVKTIDTTGEPLPPEFTVYKDVFEKMMDCVREARDAGDIRLTTIPEALAFMRALIEERESKALAEYQKKREPVPVPLEVPIQAKGQTSVNAGKDLRQKKKGR